MTWTEAFNELRRRHYGPVTASLLLESADKRGSESDGNLVVSSDRRGYRILGC